MNESNLQKLVIDDGLVRLDINGNGVLMFNPSDFNVYERFVALAKELPEIEKKYAAEVKTLPGGTEEEKALALADCALARAKDIDKEVKDKLSAVFGFGNDFDKLLGGVNILAFGSNGERIINNLMNVLLPFVEKGIKQHANNEVTAAKLNRERRRAAQNG